MVIRWGNVHAPGTRAGDGVGILLGHAVADDLPIADRQAVAGQPHHALDERHRRGLVATASHGLG